MRQPVKKALFLFGPAILTMGAILASASLLKGRAFGVAIMAVPLLLIAVFVIMDGFFLREDYLKRWTKAHGVAVTEENREVVHRYLRRGRRFRAAGGFLGYATYSVVVVVVAGDKVGIGWLRALFGGYLLGAAIAEFWAFRPQPGAPRAASLSPRSINDYVSPIATTLMRVVTLATLALVAVWQFIPKGRTFPGEVFPPSPSGESFSRIRPDFGEALAWGGIAIVLLVIVEVTTRRIVRRPQPAASEGLVAADDAIRSTGMHAVVGAGLAMQFGILGRLAGQWTSFTSGGSFHAWLGVVAMVSGFAALFTWLRLGIDQPWVVRRTHRGQEVAA